MDFRILGQLEVLADGPPVAITVPKVRILLAALLLRADRPVGIGELVDRLWDDMPPPGSRQTLQTYVLRLRRTLGDSNRIVTTTHGYQIVVGPDELDLHRFRDLVERAGRQADPAEESRLLAAALAQWRGHALADVQSQRIRSVDAPGLTEERLAALERRFDVELTLGRHANLIRELQATIGEYPLRERFYGQFMLALYRSGRQADAFTAYQDIATLLATELGVDPGDDLRAIRQKILTNSPDIATPPSREPVTARQPSVPRELPPDLGDFVGRTESRARIAELVGGGAGMPLAVVVGPAGVGKTALAVKTAHELAERFPDGQLFADMRGYSSSAALTAADVLARFLVSLGIPTTQIPSDPDELATLYRSTIADRRMLILLDNVARPAQVRPVLPGSASCAVIVTSRNDLRGLTVRQGARPISLDVLTPEQSHQLVTGIIGPDLAEPAGVAELAELCGRLPLALRIAAANVVAWHDLISYLAELRANRLSALEIDDDDESAVRATFQLSYRALDEPAARVFRLLGLIPGSDFTGHGVAALAAVSLADAGRVLDRLVAANLVQRMATRFQLHDLLRAFAAELADDESARARFFGFYMLTVDVARKPLLPLSDQLPQPDVDPVVRPEQFADSDAALSWMERECLNTLDVIVAAVRRDQHALAWRLAQSLQIYPATSGRYQREVLAAYTVALAAAVADGEHEAAAVVHHGLGVIRLYHRRDLAQAERNFADAVSAYRATGKSTRLPGLLISLAVTCIEQAKLDEAARHLSDALDVGDAVDPKLTAHALAALSLVEETRGNMDEAERAARASLELRHHDSSGMYEAEARVHLAQVLTHRGRCVDAARELEQAVPIYQRMAMRPYETMAFSLLAAAHRERGDLVAAMGAARRAMDIATAHELRISDVSALLAIADVRRAQGDLVAAAADYRTALDACQGMSDAQEEVDVLIGYATNTRMQGDLSSAAELAGRAAVMAQRNGYQPLHARATVTMARIRLAQGESGVSATIAETAALTLRRLGAWLDEAYAWHAVGAARWAGGDHEAAREAWAAAESALVDAQLLPGAEIRRLLASVPATNRRAGHVK